MRRINGNQGGSAVLSRLGRRRIAAPPPGGWGERVFWEEWTIGVVDQPPDDIVAHGILRPVRWLRPPPGTALADPAWFPLADGRTILLAEAIEPEFKRGEIWAAALAPGCDPAAAVFAPWMAAGVHLSYPFPFTDDDGTPLLTAESREAGGVFLWRRERGAWRLAGHILRGHAVLDPTLWRGADGWWLFCTLGDDGPNDRLQLFCADRPQGPWHPHADNPVKIDAAGSRPAGRLFRTDDGRLIRSAQDCSRTYGGAVVLYEITRLDRGGFRERPLRQLEPLEPYPHGLHTFCPAGERTIVDGKRWTAAPADLALKPVTGLRTRLRRRLPAGLPRLLSDFGDPAPPLDARVPRPATRS